MLSIKLGSHVRLRNTSFEGIVTKKVVCLTGEIQYCVTPETGGDGNPNEERWLDQHEIEVICQGKEVSHDYKLPGF